MMKHLSKLHYLHILFWHFSQCSSKMKSPPVAGDFMTCFDGNWNWNSIVATIPMQDSSGSLFVNWKPIFHWPEGSSGTRDGNNDDINTVCSGPVSIFAAHIKPRHSYDNSRIKPPSCHICRRGERSLVWRMWRTMLTIVVNTFTWSRWSPDKVCVHSPSCVNNIDSF